MARREERRRREGWWRTCGRWDGSWFIGHAASPPIARLLRPSSFPPSLTLLTSPSSSPTPNPHPSSAGSTLPFISSSVPPLVTLLLRLLPLTFYIAFLIPLLSSLVLSSLPDFFLLCLALNLSFVSCFFLALLHHSSLRSSFSSSSSSSSLDRCVCVCSFVSSVVWVYTSFKYVSLADRIMLLHRHTLAVISLGDWLAGGRYQEYPVGSAVRLDTESHSLSSRTFSSSCNTGMCDGTLLCTSLPVPVVHHNTPERT